MDQRSDGLFDLENKKTPQSKLEYMCSNERIPLTRRGAVAGAVAARLPGGASVCTGGAGGASDVVLVGADGTRPARFVPGFRVGAD